MLEVRSATMHCATNALPTNNGRPLPCAVRAQLEAIFEADFSDVRIHETPLSREMGALAFTYGSDIYFAPGKYNPDTEAGLDLLAHELTHVVQQLSGRTARTHDQRFILQDEDLEAEADWMGRHAAEIMFRGSSSLQARKLIRPTQPERNAIFVIQCQLEQVKDTEYTDSRNKKIKMTKTDNNAFKMPDDKIYFYDNRTRQYDDKEVLPRKSFDPVGLRPFYRETFESDEYYGLYENLKEGDIYIYNDYHYKKHDLLSDFRDGDLLYGAHSERRKIMDLIRRRVTKVNYITADNLHNVIGIGVTKEGKYNQETDKTEFQFSKLPDELKHYEKYLQEFKNSHGQPVSYHPTDVQQSRAKTKSEKYSDAAAKKIKISVKDIQIRRSCKALLDFMLEQTDARIHFIKNGIEKHNGFTMAELKHVYKMRLNANANLFFYESGTKVPTPDDKWW